MYQQNIGNYTVQLWCGAEGAMNRNSVCLLLLVWAAELAEKMELHPLIPGAECQDRFPT
jgi:hypothetical protein